MSTPSTREAAAKVRSSAALTITELRSFHPDGNPVGHPGLSAGLRGYADRKNRQAFTPAAGRPADATDLAGGMLVLPQGVDPVVGEQLERRIKAKWPDRAVVRCGCFFSGNYSLAARGEGRRVIWGEASICLDISGVTKTELAEIARDVVAHAGCAAALLRHATGHRIDLVSEPDYDSSRTDSLLSRLFRRGKP